MFCAVPDTLSAHNRQHIAIIYATPHPVCIVLAVNRPDFNHAADRFCKGAQSND
jgi:hypothetical protein